MTPMRQYMWYVREMYDTYVKIKENIKQNDNNTSEKLYNTNETLYKY